MSNSTIEKEIIEQIHKLPYEKQQQVLDYARNLTGEKVKSISGKDFLRFAGSIEKDELDKISKAIEEGCEQVDINEW